MKGRKECKRKTEEENKGSVKAVRKKLRKKEVNNE